jgi:tetratricopeptide (TPR) repeat protein
VNDVAVEKAPNEQAVNLHERGIALARQRRFDEAAGLFRQTIEADDNYLDGYRHLAQAYSDGGRWAEAEKAWVGFLERRPESADGHRHLGNLRKRMEKFDSAIEALKRAVELDEKSSATRVDYGIALAGAQRRDEAKKAFTAVLEADADYYDAHINLGILLQEMREPEESVRHLRRAVELRPEDPSGYNNLGVALSEQGKLNEAIECYQKLLEISPDYVLAWNNLGNSLRAVGRYDEAVMALNKALENKPDYVEAYNNLGIIHAQAEDYSKAIASYDRAIMLRPDYPEAHANRGLVYLLLGNFQQGWADYEWRWQGQHGMKRRSYAGKMWDGSPLAGKRILLYYEQGLGDTFQFIRYAKELKDRGATVIFECQPHTRQILSRTPGVDEFIVRGEKLPKIDFYAPLLGLPGLCQTHLDNLPRRVPYIFADPAMAWDWKRRMAGVDGFRVGIVWQGNPEHKGDKNRSIPLAAFEPLASVEGVRLISLQKNLGVEQIAALDGKFGLEQFEGVAEDVDGWLRTAAIIANLDLLICADTSVAHLAGAMGVPVWIALPKSPDWRWLLERDDTPWYPTVRLFRQAVAQDWNELLGRMAEALRQRLSVSTKTLSDPSSDRDQQEAQRLLRKAAEHLSREELADAQKLLLEAIGLDPSNSGVYQDLGVVHAKRGQLDDAMRCFMRALELLPDSPAVYSNLGLACYHTGRFEEAVSHLRKAIWLGAGSADTHKNLARALVEIGDPAGAEESYWAALKLKPDDAESHYHLARVLLQQGKFEQGWLEYEWRWKWLNAPARQLQQPRWSGQDPKGRKILIVSEQDDRETIQLARYADVIAQAGGQVILECKPSLVKLMAGCVGVRTVIAGGDPLPPHDFHVHMGSLPATMATTIPTVPASRPYLGVNTGLAESWRRQISEVNGFRVGIALEADKNSDNRSKLYSECIEKIVAIPGVSPLDLQPGRKNVQGKPENKSPFFSPTGVKELDLGTTDSPDTMANIAAILHCVDLLITVDNSIAHIAGAMGIATWLLLPVCPEPRWLLRREDNPWYPTIRLFRQRQRHDWSEVIMRLNNELHAVVRQTESQRINSRTDR